MPNTASNQATLYLANKTYSSWSLRGWLAVKLAGVAFKESVIPLGQTDTTANILPHSPSARLPALVRGSVRIWDSLAIGEYLAETFPEARLWPADGEARAHARSVCAEMHSGFPDLRRELPMNIRRIPSPFEISADVQRDITRIAEIWATCRELYGAGGDYLFGQQGLADAFFAPVVSRFTSYCIPLDRVCQAYCDAVWRWPAMQEWRAAAQDEPWVNSEYER